MGKFVTVLVAAAAALLLGCGDGRLKVVPAKGKLQLQGKDGKLTPIAGARIMFHPVKKADNFPAFPVATTAEDGSFELGTSGKADGAPEGEYVVTIDWRKKIKPKYDIMGKGEVATGPDLLRGAYADSTTSKLRATVTAGEELNITVPAP
jgi:hypothetical protein